jgi:periplasmic protein TonB
MHGVSTKRSPEAFPDFLEPVLALEQRSLGRRLSIAVALALVLHSAGAFGAAATLGVGKFAALAVEHLRAQLAEREVDLLQDPTPPPPPEPEPEPPPPEPEAPPPMAAPEPPPANEPPPATAEAANVLTAEPDPNEPLDLTDQGIIVGTGDSYAGGQTSSSGKSKVAVHNPQAAATGVVGGKGTAVAQVVPAISQAREARTLNKDWDCGFPPEADMDQVSRGRVQIAVTVGADGRAKSVTVLTDPGHGFGRRARQCAMTMPYAPALDVTGRPITKTTPPFWVTFKPKE